MNSQVFDQKYASLNPAQKSAVDAIDGPVMVIAGPGTGKTTILTLRIANILRCTDTPPSGILAITYTDAGVKAMRAKLREIIGNRAHEVALHTFHSFSSSIIAEYPDHFLHLDGLMHMTDIEQESLVRSIIADPLFRDIRPTGKPDAYVSAIMRTIDDAKREALTPEMVREHARAEISRIKNDDSSISTRGVTKGKLKADAQERIGKCERTQLFADVYDRYEKEKRASKKMDFNDLIIELLVALRNDELLLRLIQERFLYLLVDEHQDTNDAQNFIVATIAEFFDTPNIFIVGDEKQAIYRFQGASVENFLTLQKRWPAMHIISLDTNYRSHQGILDASFAMIENNYEGDEHRDLRVELKAGKSAGKTAKKLQLLDIVTGENTAAIEAYLVRELKGIVENEPAATVAVITRRNRDLERIIRLLESAHIPVSSERSVDIFHHPIGMVFFDLLEYFSNPARTDALARTIAVGMWSIPFEESITLMKALRSGQTAHLETKIPVLLQLQKEMNDDGAVGFLVHAATASGFATIASRDPAASHVWRGIITLAESLARDGNISNPGLLMQSMLAYRLSAESKTVKVSVGAPDLPIQAMTAHGSKGLEFDYVFIPYATEDAWVGRARGASFLLPQKRVGDHDIRDTRRLFYVALTRAKKHAVVLTALEESDGKALTPLRFIAELDPDSVAAVSVPRIQTELPKNDTDRTHIDEHSVKMIALAKRVLSETGLSVTALNHFLECPNKFLYLSILKLPQAPSAAAEKGTAMHEAISNVWKGEDRTALHIEETIRESVTAYFDTSFLAAAEKESVKKDLLDDTPAVARALESHFNAPGGTPATKSTIFTERWIKTAFEGSHENRQVTLPLHGKLDALIDTGNELLIFDYKTREGMSENEIRGLTKNSTGDYFRQLVFYRILVADEPRWKGRRIVPNLVFVSPDAKGRCPIVSLPITDEDISAVKQHIQNLIDSVWSGELVTKKCDDSQCEWCSLAKMSGNK
jgi:DNA helicase-2/ATP-dependent DNA helicase PcrA